MQQNKKCGINNSQINYGRCVGYEIKHIFTVGPVKSFSNIQLGFETLLKTFNLPSSPSLP